MSRRKSGAAATPPRRAGLWWGTIPAGVVLMLAPGSVVLIGAILAPAVLLGMLPGQHGGMRTVRVSVLFGLAACVHPLHALWSDDSSIANTLAMLHQPTVLATGWIALLAGWLVCEIGTAVLRLHADIAASGLRRQMAEQITRIEEEWGPMPASAPLPPL